MRCMEQRLVENKHAISSWLTVRLTRDTMKTVLVIETDLVHNAQDMTAMPWVAYLPGYKSI
jgi:hypothetical protein